MKYKSFLKKTAYHNVALQRRKIAVTFFIAGLLLNGCIPAPKLQLSAPLAEQSVQLPAKGTKGKGWSRKFTIGDFYSNDLQAGWQASKATYDKMPFFSLEQTILANFNLRKDDLTTTQSNQYSYSLSRGGSKGEVHCFEKTTRTVTSLRRPGEFEISKTKHETYGLAASIKIAGEPSADFWQLLLLYDRPTPDGAVTDFRKMGVPAEKGYLWQGQDTIWVRQLKMTQTKDRKGELVDLPFAIIGGYEFVKGNGDVAATVDVLAHTVWLLKRLTPKEELLMTSAAAALLLRRER